MMAADDLKILQQVNASLRAALIHLHPQERHCSTITPQDFADLLSEILRAAACVRRPPAAPGNESEAALEKETLDYGSNLEKLRNFLPELHVNLLAEKSRLETAQSHVAVAAAWARASSRAL
jgi:hypothetical protein